jgi:Cu2+-exporting ATPase
MKKYVCPMGCIELQDQPGNCPECGMKLIEIEEEDKNHKDHDKHAGHKAEDFLKKFWLSLILTLIVIFVSFTLYQSIARYGALSALLGSIVFFYGGWVFIIGALREIKAKNPGMMTLIALAISSAYIYSLFITLSDLLRWSTLSPRMSAFWLELTSLITIMLLGHYFEMQSVSSDKEL